MALTASDNGAQRTVLDLAPELAEGARVRELLRGLAAEMGFSADRTFDIQVAVSEAVANAIEHVSDDGAVQVRVDALRDRLEVSVWGRGTFSVPAEPEGRRHRGLGLPLMAKLADHLALHSDAEGRTQVGLTFYLPCAAGSDALTPSALHELNRQATALALERQRLLDSALATARMAHWEWKPSDDSMAFSDSATDLFGLLAGQTVETGAAAFGLVHPDDVESHRRTVESALEDGQAWHSEFRIVRPRDGQTAWLEERGRAGRDPKTGEVRVAGLLWDITRRKLADEQLSRVQGRVEADLEAMTRLQQLARSSWRQRTLEPALLEVVDAALAIAGADFGNVQLVDDSDCGLVIVAQRGFPQWWIDYWNGPGRERGCCGDTLANRERVIVEDIEKGPEFAGTPALEIQLKAGVRAVQSMLITSRDGQPLGVFSTHFARPHRPDEPTLKLLDVLARQAGDIIERFRAEEALGRSEARYRSLFDSIDEGFCIIEVLFDEAGRPVDYRFLEVNAAFERHTGLKDAVGRRVRELAPGVDEHWFEIYGEVALTGRPARFQQSAVALGRFYDVYAFRTGEPRERQVAVLFNDVSERKRAEEELRRSQARQAYLLELSDAVRPLTDPLEIQGEAARVLGEHLGTDRAFYAEIVLRDGVEYAVAERDFRSPGTPSVAGRYPLERFSAARIAEHRRGRPAVVPDVESDPLLSEDERAAYRAIDVRGYVAVPLLKKGRMVGVLSVNQRKPRAWTPEEVALVEETAERTWSAAERARTETALRVREEMYRALADENERLYRQQLEIAESLQGALMHIPAEIGPLRVGHLYRSATEAAHIGGDFYDVFEVAEGKVAVLIGDVSGHGIEAARLAALTKDVIHAFAHQSPLPEQILEQTNSLLVKKALGGFVTLFLGVLDLGSLELDYATAGHPEALVRHASGEVRPLLGGSPPLGVFENAAWRLGRVDLGPDDLLLLYTDGLIEARRDGCFFGEERLQEFLREERAPVKHLPGLILDQVLSFSEGVLRDDLAILALLIGGRRP